MGKGLSPLQREILLYVQRNCREAPPGVWACFWYPHGEIPRTYRYGPDKFDQGRLGDYSSQAIARALLRLEKRGYLTRENWISGNTKRTINVVLTPTGRELTVNFAHHGP